MATMSPMNNETPKFFGAAAVVTLGSVANFEKSEESSKYLTKFSISICRTSDGVPCAGPGWGHRTAQPAAAWAVRPNVLPVLHLPVMIMSLRSSPIGVLPSAQQYSKRPPEVHENCPKMWRNCDERHMNAPVLKSMATNHGH